MNSWKYIIWILLAKRILEYSQPVSFKFIDPVCWRKLFNRNAGYIYRFLRQNYGSISPSFAEIIADRSREIRSISLHGAGVNAQPEESSSYKLSRAINVVNKELQSRIIHLLSANRQYYMLFDQLDLGWDNTDETKQLISGLILAAREVVRCAEKEGKKVHIVLFLRSDIYETLRFEDKNKISPDVVELRWEESRLKELASKRIQVSADGSWEDLFTGEPMRQQLSQLRYIVRRTMLRPRDMIQYCVFARDVAMRSNKSRIDKASVYDAERPYSDYMRKEIQDESKALPIPIDTLFGILQEVREDRVRKDDFLSLCQNKGISGDLALRLLIDLSIFGIYRAGGPTGGSTIVYKYQSQPWDALDPSPSLAVHPSLKHALSLTETRAHRQDGQTSAEDEM